MTEAVQEAVELVDRLAPWLDGAQRHGAIIAVLTGWDPRTPKDVERWLARTGVKALEASPARQDVTLDPGS